MIENFDERYAKLLSGVQKESCVMLSSVESRGGYLCQPQEIVTSKDDLQCAEDAFIMRYCLGTISEV